MITFPLQFPDIKIESYSLAEIMFNVTETTSSRQDRFTQLNAGSRWIGEFTTTRMNKSDSEYKEWRKFISSIQGRHGTFMMPIWESEDQPAFSYKAVSLSDSIEAGSSEINIKIIGTTNIDDISFLTIANNVYEIINSTQSSIDGLSDALVISIRPNTIKAIDLTEDTTEGVSGLFSTVLTNPTPCHCVARALEIDKPTNDRGLHWTNSGLVWEQEIQY